MKRQNSIQKRENVTEVTVMFSHVEKRERGGVKKLILVSSVEKTFLSDS